MNEQDPLSTYSLWAKQASILEDQDEGDSTQTIKPNGANGTVNQKENMDERRRQYGSKGRGDSGYGGPATKVIPKKGMTRRRLVPSSDDEDAIVYADESTQTALGPTPPASQYKGEDDEYASTTRKLARIALENGHPQESAIKAAKSKRDAQPPPALKPEVAAAQEDSSKKSWSKRALARTKDILSITAKEPSTFAFEEFREREFKKAGVKAGDNAAAKLHVSSQKLPPEAPKVQSKEPPPITRNATDANTNANKSVGRFKSSGAKTTDGNYAGPGQRSNHSLASSTSNHSSARLGSGRVSFTGSAQGSASGSGSAGGSEIGQAQSMGLPPLRLRHSQTDGSASRVGTATSVGRGQMPPTKVLSGKQKAAAIDDRW